MAGTGRNNGPRGWWVTATPAGTDPDDAAMAVVRITDSRHPLRYGSGYSARIS